MFLQKDKAAKANTAASKANWKQRSGSVIGKYVDGRGILRSQSEEEEDVFGLSRRRSSLGLSGYPFPEEEPGAGGPFPRAFRRIISIEEDPLPQLLDGSFEQPLSKCPEEEEVSQQRVQGQSQQTRPLEPMPTSPRGQPVGKEALSKVRTHPVLVCRCHSYACPLHLNPRAPKASQEVRCGWSHESPYLCPSDTSLLYWTEGHWGDSGVLVNSLYNFCCLPYSLPYVLFSDSDSKAFTE